MNAWLMVLQAFATAVSLVLLIPCLVLLAEVVAGLRKARQPEVGSRTPDPLCPRPPLAVLIPAHNEVAGIVATLQSVRAACQPDDRIVVVADNCSDATADLARSCGVEVLERQDSTRRGKGYALDFGVQHLAHTGPPAVVVLVDADCLVGPGAVDACTRLSLQSGRPVQSLYLMHLPANGSGATLPASLKARVGAFAWGVKNRLRPTGALTLGWPCQLMGTGMAFPWPLLRDAALASSHLVEDMQLGIDLARAGHPPLFCPQAVVSSVFPSQTAGLDTQRTRWEHGHLAVIAQQGPALIATAIRRLDARLLGMALDLCVPPLASLVMAVGAWALVMALAAGLGLGSGPAAVALTGLLALVIAIYLAWRVEGRALISGGEWARLPLYAVAKLPLYLGWWRRRQTEWVRTERDPATPPITTAPSSAVSVDPKDSA